MSPKALGWLGAVTSALGIVLMFVAWSLSRGRAARDAAPTERQAPGIIEGVVARAAGALIAPDEAQRFGNWLAGTRAEAQEQP